MLFKLLFASVCLFLFGGPVANPQTSTGQSAVLGTWEGVLQYPKQTLRIVVHISQTDNGLTATSDSPDQGGFGITVDSISFTGSTLTFEITRLNVRFDGDLLPDGSVRGEFVQRGSGLPLVLARSNGAAPPASGSVQNGRYHHDQTGLEFNVPVGFSVQGTYNYMNNNGWQAILIDSEDHKLNFAVWMAKRSFPANVVPTILAKQVPAKIARRKGLTGYQIPAESIQKMSINGQQAVKATASYQNSDGQKMTELLTWITTEHTDVHFYAMVPTSSVPDLQWRFDQMVQSAMVP
jgi:hypothetical protein